MPDGDSQSYQRAAWGNKLEFFFAMLGSCVGLGNVWRFPYLCYKNGGGAFLIPYVLMVLLVGLPVFVLETSIGQFSSRSVINVWSLSPLFKGLGIGSLIVGVFIALYYNVLVAQFVYYLILSMNSVLPWTGCCAWWGASSCCRECPPDKDDCQPTCENEIYSPNCTKYNLPAQEFYSTYVLQLSSGIEEFGYPVWQLSLCLLGVWIAVTLVLLFGAKSFGKVAYFTALFPYVMLTVMLIYGATLPGSLDGVIYYITPVWEKLLDPLVWMDAAGQAFFSISAGMGLLTSLGSYNQFDHPLVRDGMIIVIADMLTSIYSGFAVFTVLGYMALENNVNISDVVEGGPGLVFEAYPAALATMPVAPLWSILFFLMLLTLGMGSSLSIVEGVLLSLQDVLRRHVGGSKKANVITRVSVCTIFFLCGLPMTFQGGIYLLNLIDAATGTFGVLSIGLAECLVIVWVYDWRRFRHDLEYMTGWHANFYFIACWLAVSPLILIVVLIMNIILYQAPTYNGYHYPDWALAMQTVLMVLPILAIPLWMIYYHCIPLKYWIVIRESARPTRAWGPSNRQMHMAYLEVLPPKLKKFNSKKSIGTKYANALIDASADDFDDQAAQAEKHNTAMGYSESQAELCYDAGLGYSVSESSRF